MTKRKYLFYLMMSIICLFFSIDSYKEWSRHKEIIENNNPIVCKVILTSCGTGRGLHPYSNIEYNGLKYNKILTNKCEELKLGLNDKDFYYDKKNDTIINKYYDYHGLFVGFSLLSFVFLLVSIKVWYQNK